MSFEVDRTSAFCDKPFNDKERGILSDRDIKREILNKNIVFYDPDRDCNQNIQNCSIDITIGPNIWRQLQNNFKTYSDPWNHESKLKLITFNPWNESHVKMMWTKDEAKTVRNYRELGIEEDTKGIILQPHEFILAHTNEFIGGKNYITTMMKARSSIGRSNITVCRCAGLGDIGFISRWTMEITNNNDVPIFIPLNARVGQIVFFYTGISDTTYKGKYQKGDNLEEIVKDWTPEMMLPKLYLDKN
jgi:dCTP deaminase